MLEIFANIIGLCAVVLFVLSYQMKARRGIILCNAASRVFYVTQYILLGA
ncbi:MAG: YgjV family protein, partial [Clostridia bacterium]|nr:YgjV family protein [Clostridia bacterium]